MNRRISQFGVLTAEQLSTEDYFPVIDASETNPAQKNKRTSLSAILSKFETFEVTAITDTGTAGAAITAGRAVMLQDGLLYHYDPTNVNNYGRFVGVSVSAGAASSTITYVRSGFTGVSGLTANSVLYSTSNGTITNVTPSTGVYQEIGYAATTSSMLVRTGQPRLMTSAGIEFTELDKNKLDSLSTLRKAPVQSRAILQAIPQTQCEDKEDRFVENDKTYYAYDAHSSGGTGQLAPSGQVGGIGFWVPITHLGGHTADEITETPTKVFVTPQEKAKINLDYGYTTNPTTLVASHPIGAEGAFIRVGSTDTIWIWSTNTNEWVDTTNPISGYTHPNHFGDVASAGDGQTVIQPGAVTFAKINDNVKAASGEVSGSKFVVANDERLTGGGGGGGVTDHSELSGLQGGQEGEHYHLTLAQLNSIGAPVYWGGLQIQNNDSQTIIQYINTRVRPKAYQTLPDGTPITWDMALGDKAVVTLVGNRTLQFANLVNGDTGVLIVKQDATGSRTLALPGTSRVINGGGGVIALTPAANSVTILSFTYDGTNYYWTYGLNYT